MQNEDARLKALIDEILGKNAVTPGRAMTREEQMNPVLREALLRRLGWWQDRTMPGPGMFDVQKK